MGAEGVRRRCDAVCTASTISQAKGQGFKSTETKHHVYGFLWKVDSFYRLFSYYLFIFIYLLLIFFAQVEGGCRPAQCDPQRRGENYDFYRCTGKDR